MVKIIKPKAKTEEDKKELQAKKILSGFRKKEEEGMTSAYAQ